MSAWPKALPTHSGCTRTTVRMSRAVAYVTYRYVPAGPSRPSRTQVTSSLGVGDFEMADAGRDSAIIAACSQVCCKRYTNAFQTLRKRIPSCGYSECVITRRSTFARDYETFLNVDGYTYRRDSRVARLVIRYFRYESASRPVYLTPGNLECLPDIASQVQL